MIVHTLKMSIDNTGPEQSLVLFSFVLKMLSALYACHMYYSGFQTAMLPMVCAPGVITNKINAGL